MQEYLEELLEAPEGDQYDDDSTEVDDYSEL